MSKIIEELWRGNLEPIAYSGVNNREIKELIKIKIKNQEKLENLLDNNAKEIFEKYNVCSNEYLSVALEQAFCDGFCLGTKITAEALLSTNADL